MGDTSGSKLQTHLSPPWQSKTIQWQNNSLLVYVTPNLLHEQSNSLWPVVERDPIFWKLPSDLWAQSIDLHCTPGRGTASTYRIQPDAFGGVIWNCLLSDLFDIQPSASYRVGPGGQAKSQELLGPQFLTERDIYQSCWFKLIVTRNAQSCDEYVFSPL